MNKAPNILVAACDAPKHERQAAHYQCDGVADDIEINAAIDIPNTIANLCTKYSATSWYKSVSDHLSVRYGECEDRMRKTFKFVTLAKDNGLTYSYEYSGILRDTVSTLSSVLDSLARNTARRPKKQYGFSDYCAFLAENVPDIQRRIVAVTRLFPLILVPFSALEVGRANPPWWTAYNKVKHAEVDKCRLANMANALGSLAALAVLGSQLGCFLRTNLFVNVGLVYPIHDPSVKAERILFDMN